MFEKKAQPFDAITKEQVKQWLTSKPVELISVTSKINPDVTAKFYAQQPNNAVFNQMLDQAGRKGAKPVEALYASINAYVLGGDMHVLVPEYNDSSILEQLVEEIGLMGGEKKVVRTTITSESLLQSNQLNKDISNDAR